MNRRNLLIGIGTAAVGTGGVLGSGALTQVNADRSVSVNVADDSTAALGLEPNTVQGITTSGSGQLELNLGDLNDEAVTTFGVISGASGPISGSNTNASVGDGDQAFKIVNNSVGDVEVDVSNVPTIIDLVVDDPNGGVDTFANHGAFTLTNESELLVVVQVDTNGDASGANGDDDTGVSSTGSITFTATTTGTPAP